MDETSTPLPARVIQAFGGLTNTHKKTGIPLSTIDSWQRNNKIPSWRLPAIREAAKTHDVTLPEDFPDEVAA